MQDYVLISQNKIQVEVFTRQGDEWARTELNRLEDVLRLDSIDCEVPLSGIYAKTFPAVEPGETND